MAKYQAYSEYDAAGDDCWFDCVPSHWEVKRISYVAQLKSGDSIISEQIEAEGDYPVYGGNGHRGYTNKFNHEGDYILIGRQGALCGNINYASGQFWASEHAVVVHPTVNVDLKWLGETLRAMDLNQYNISAAQPGLAVANITCLKIPYPNIVEQEKIASFLDHETAKIDTLIDKQQQLIQLLKEKCQAVISHAVTKGLNPNAPMRDSGVEWLGEVPEHWEVKPLKFLIKDERGAVKTGPFGSHLKNSDMEGSDIKVISQRNIISRDFDIGESMVSLNKYRELQGFTIFKNDILVTTRGTIGRAFIYCKDDIAILHPCLIRLQVKDELVFPELVALIIQESGYAMEQILLNSNATTIEVIYSENLINTIICLPPALAEQKKILSFIEEQKSNFDDLIDKAQSAIELMQERRTALISAAVTGKIDVRGFALPDEDNKEAVV